MFKAVVPNSDDKGIILVKGVPFGGPTDKDIHGQYFTQRTNFLPHVLPLPLVFHFHGAKSGSLAEPVGETLGREQRDDGIWYRAKLFLDSTVEQVRTKATQLWDAAIQDKLFASSGAVEATIKIADNGEIMQWLVGELSLVDTRSNREAPASFHATVIPIKADLTNVETGTLTLDRLKIAEDPAVVEIDTSQVPGILSSVSQFIKEITGYKDRGVTPPTNDLSTPSTTTTRRVDDMSGENEALTLLQKQVAELTTQLAVIPQLTTQVTELTGQLEARDATIKQLQSTISTKSAEAQMGVHAAMVDNWIKDGKITPAERDATLDALSHAYRSDMAAKGDSGFVDAVKSLIESRPANPLLSGGADAAAIYNNIGTPNATTQGPGGGVDPANVARLKRYAELPE